MGNAYAFMMERVEWLHDRVQLTSDDLNACGSAVEAAFRANVSYSQRIKPKGSEPGPRGPYKKRHE